MKKLIFLMALSILLFSSCGTTYFENYYSSWDSDGLFPAESYLAENEAPVILKTDDLISKFRETLSEWYWCIGYSGFNGIDYPESDMQEDLQNLCKEKKAKIAIWSKTYTDTQNGVYSVPHTNYHSYTGSNGMIHSYTTTSYLTMPYFVKRYDYSAYFFIPMTDETKSFYMPGITVSDLTQQDRDSFKQNTGCLVCVVYKNSTAFYANLARNDIIVNINGTQILTMKDFLNYKNLSKIGDKWDMVIIRDGSEKHLNLVYGL